MVAPRHLQNPPINEAVLDVRVTFNVPPAIDALGAMSASLPGYAEAGRIQNIISVVLAGNAAQTGPVIGPQDIGVSFRSVDGLHVLQVRRDGLSLSRLRPYSDWEQLFNEMWRAWETYKAVVKPNRVKRVSTRFINQINIPLGRDLDDFFVVSPRLPEGAPNFISAFSSTVGIPYQDQKSNAFMRMAQLVTNNPTVMPIILDFDILHDCDLSPDDDDSVRDNINALRSIKNQLFFGSVKDPAMELFQ
ncbi:MAG TPA: TIGR04255 family protein [Candidatus Saccharimonadales bacterium]|nr:TIGR04255 family protein [Candidatus Saccharimonadales bacterium]